MRIMTLHAPSPIVRELCRRGHDIFACNSTRSFDTIDDLPPEWGPKQRSQNFAGYKKLNLSAIRQVSTLCREFQPEVLHAFTPSSVAWAVLGTLSSHRPPRIVTFRGIMRPLHRMDPTEWITYLSPRVSMHACESQAVLEVLVRCGIPKHKCHVVYNTVWDFESVKTREQWRSEWGVDNETLLLGTVGHVRPIKRIDLLLQAASQLPSSLPWKIVIGGHVDDPAVRKLASTDALRDRVLFPGRLSPAPDAMRAFDLFVMPSRSEGLCRALIEAMTVGVCPIVSDAGGMKELVRHGRDGLVFPSGDSAALQRAVMDLVCNPERRMAMANSAAQRARELCSVKVVVDKLTSIYASLSGLESRSGGYGSMQVPQSATEPLPNEELSASSS